MRVEDLVDANVLVGYEQVLLFRPMALERGETHHEVIILFPAEPQVCLARINVHTLFPLRMAVSDHSIAIVTDRSNPTANHISQAIGDIPIADIAELRFVP